MHDTSLVKHGLGTLLELASPLLLHFLCTLLPLSFAEGLLSGAGKACLLLGWRRLLYAPCLLCIALRLGLQNTHHLRLERFLILLEPVLLPSVIKHFRIKVVSL